jgi:hypothetical protein
MYSKILKDASFYSLQIEIDKKTASAMREKGCPCGGGLNVANFQRKTRGVPESIEAKFNLRFSFCCNKEGCRKRKTPPTVRFAGRKLWAAQLVLILSGDCSSQTEKCFKQKFGASSRVIRQWRHWWAQIFSQSKFWTKSRFRVPGLKKGSPFDLGALLIAFREHIPDLRASLLHCLGFFSEGWEVTLN